MPFLIDRCQNITEVWMTGKRFRTVFHCQLCCKFTGKSWYKPVWNGGISVTVLLQHTGKNCPVWKWGSRRTVKCRQIFIAGTVKLKKMPCRRHDKRYPSGAIPVSDAVRLRQQIVWMYQACRPVERCSAKKDLIRLKCRFLSKIALFQTENGLILYK